MAFYDIDDDKLQAYYHRAWLEANRGFVDPRKYRYLDDAIMYYTRENNCTYDEALSIFNVIYLPTWALEGIVAVCGLLTFLGAYLFLYRKNERSS